MRVVDPPVPSRLLFVAFVVSIVGPFAVSHLIVGLRRIPFDDLFSAKRLWQTTAIQVVLGTVWMILLRRRGWSWACVTLPVEVRDLLRGTALLLVGLLAYRAAEYACLVIMPGARPFAEVLPAARVSFWTVAVTSLVNPLFEELVYLGFLSNVLRRRGPISAIVPAVAVRLALHLYQGVPRAVGIGALGGVWTLCYDRTRRLWPLVVAHALLDFGALAAMNWRAD